MWFWFLVHGSAPRFHIQMYYTLYLKFSLTPPIRCYSWSLLTPSLRRPHLKQNAFWPHSLIFFPNKITQHIKDSPPFWPPSHSFSQDHPYPSISPLQYVLNCIFLCILTRLKSTKWVASNFACHSKHFLSTSYLYNNKVIKEPKIRHAWTRSKS